MRFFAANKNIGIDLGTSNTLLYVKGKGILLKEPSVLAINVRNNKVLAVGSDAKKMIGRTPEDVITIKPLKDGVIANLDMAQQMLKMFIKKVTGKIITKGSDIVICHPAGVTEVEKRVLSDATREVGARKSMLIEEAIAAALGAGLPVHEPIGNMIINIGGGTTEVSVISLGGIVTSISSKIAGDELDDTIINFVKKEFNLSIGEITAERIKIELGSVYDDNEEKEMQISGSDLITGLPRIINIKASEIREILREPISLLLETIRTALEKTEPELAADIMENGITLSGGGALLKGLDKLIYDEMRIPAYIAENPIECVALGAGLCLDTLEKIKRL